MRLRPTEVRSQPSASIFISGSVILITSIRPIKPNLSLVGRLARAAADKAAADELLIPTELGPELGDNCGC